MSYSMLTLGHLSLGVGSLTPLMAASIDPFNEPDGWIGTLAPHLKSDIALGTDLFTKLPAYLLPGHSWLEIVRDEASISIIGLLGEDDFLSYGPALAMLFRQAARFGCTGELAFLEEQTIFTEQEPEYSFLIAAAPGHVEITHPTYQQQRRYRKSPAFERLASRSLEVSAEQLHQVMEFRRIKK